MLNIIVPMAGRGSRFAKAGFNLPKPLIEIRGKPMIGWVIDNIAPATEHRFVFVCQKEHVERHALRPLLGQLAPRCEVVEIDGITDGAACTVLAAGELIDNDDALMIANSDQWVEADIDAYLRGWERSRHAGHVMTMKSTDPKWSYVKFDAGGHVADVIEKEVVSNEATVGIYNFTSGSDFCRCARAMIAEDNRSKGEFYVAPVYKYMIDEGRSVGVHNIGSDQDGMHGLGTPDDLAAFLRYLDRRDG